MTYRVTHKGLWYSQLFAKLSLLDEHNIPKTQQQLEAEGWKIATATRTASLDRILKMYRELNVQFDLEEVKPDPCEGCTKCLTENKETIYRICTKQTDI
jgi:hypothetical protein